MRATQTLAELHIATLGQRALPQLTPVRRQIQLSPPFALLLYARLAESSGQSSRSTAARQLCSVISRCYAFRVCPLMVHGASPKCSADEQQNKRKAGSGSVHDRVRRRLPFRRFVKSQAVMVCLTPSRFRFLCLLNADRRQGEVTPWL